MGRKQGALLCRHVHTYTDMLGTTGASVMGKSAAERDVPEG